MSAYRKDFSQLTGGKEAYNYQEALAIGLRESRHLIVRAPTGAGKTLSVLAPFILYRAELIVAGLIYVLPLRSLVEAIAEEAQSFAGARGLKVAVQTGERADAEFFHDADIIVTTFDQLLSGLLCEPYGLSNKLWNINASAIAGKMVVFDEFHLMEPDRAFASALFGVSLYKDLCISIWMTATATSPLVQEIARRLAAKEITVSPKEMTVLFEGRGINRSIETHWEKLLTAREILDFKGQRVLVVVNTVKRAQSLFKELCEKWPARLLHSRFFSDDRREKQQNLKDCDLIIATQVIEAGVDISSQILLTENAPVNALVQRSGRCARFQNETGTVHIFGESSTLPYNKHQLDIARKTVKTTQSANPTVCQQWVEEAHSREDREAMTGAGDLEKKRREFLLNRVTGEGNSGGVAALIRTGEDSVRVYILSNPVGVAPQTKQSIQLRRSTVQKYQRQAWVFAEAEWERCANLATAHSVAVPPEVARYTKDVGLELGLSGEQESPEKPIKPRPGWSTLTAELWRTHTKNVLRCALDRLEKEGLPTDQFKKSVEWTSMLHDVGKLQHRWQDWALRVQEKRGKPMQEALAHTDYDWKVHRGEQRPPPHSSASALNGWHYLDELTETEQVAITLAVLSHHGGTIAGLQPMDRLHPNATQALSAVGLRCPEPSSHPRLMLDLKECITESFEVVWPLAAILVRVLRLSDQKATAEAAHE